jgi:hypothetical protein
VSEDSPQHDPPASQEEPEEVDALPVLAGVRAIERRPLAAPLVVQAAAVAASGFVAGAATAAVVRHHRLRKAAKRRRRRGAGQVVASVVATRSFLVDVHLLGGRE